MNPNEIDNEKQYLEKVKSVIQKIYADASSKIAYSKQSVNDEKRFMWENSSDYSDEELAMAMYEVDKRVSGTNVQIVNINRFEKAWQSPYFAKINFKYNDGEELAIYIGITSVEEKNKYYVYDWRAPISSMFYNYEIGKAEYDTPEGKVQGEITNKMQFKIVEGKLIRCFKCNLNIDDDYLQDILANASSEKMQNIVSTIQKDQNAIIRNVKDKYLVVQGVAGSGKTSVAMHRIAYLLYQDLKLTSNNILIFAPNEVFAEYISNVLPELGEQNVLKSTFADFARAFLKPYKKIESFAQFLERVYNSPDNKVVKEKMTDDYYAKLEEFYQNYLANLKFKIGIKHNDKIFWTKDLNDLFHNRYAKFPLSERLDKVAENICNYFHLSISKQAKKIRNSLIEQASIELNFFNIYSTFLKSQFNEDLTYSKMIHYEDICGLLYLNFEINGYPNYSHIRHIVIDEVQDYSLFQTQLIKKIFHTSSFTLLGDVNQTINPYYKYASLRKLADLFSNGNYLKLDKTYRSSEEIIAYTNNILGITNACSIRRNNNIPVVKKEVTRKELKGQLLLDIKEMLNLKIKRIAIISKNVSQARNIFNLLKDKLEVELVTEVEHTIKSSIVIIPSYLSKGLEFAGVIVYNDEKNSYEDKDNYLYYVICTRAQHKLVIYNEPKMLTKL